MSSWVAGILAIIAIVLAGSRLVKNDDERRAEKKSWDNGPDLSKRRRK